MARLPVWVLGLALAAFSACQGERSALPAVPQGVLSSAEAIAAGGRLYQRNCAICHGRAGHGDGPQARSLRPAPADLRNLRGVRSEPGYWFFRIKEGGDREPLARPGSAMPAWGEHLSEREIWQVVAYLKTLVQGAP